MPQTNAPKRFAFALTAAASAAAMMAPAPAPALAVPAGGYADLVETISPAVVFVEVTAKAEPTTDQQGMYNDKFMEDFMRRFGGRAPDFGNSRQVKGAGSGFVISEDGLIVTNHHVINNAQTVSVTLSDGSKHDAMMIGADPLTDIALLKVETGAPLTAVEFGSSGDLRVGDEVLAMGSPFGLAGTVTSGIVSATSRNINSGPFDDFIQTDAAINKGNSGGPLFNAEGEVVGVNTMIYSPGGGSVGIGFAVPSDMVQKIVADLEDDGEITRGWLGVQIKPLSEDAANVLGREAGKGVVIEGVEPGSPAAEAGLKPGDVVLRFGKTETVEVRDLTSAVAMNPPGAETRIQVLRKGKEVTLNVILGDRASQDA
ncbi:MULTISPECIES: trypsin-like peptidase domain-containing protein [unclassified Leisingera]|uniref:trypsin-like peptidase domain-containing protein n=1 Tax=unclassified Leisingera TaxID=2614906 RepID=UPI0002DB57A0|nr:MULTISPECIES: trypsin-like peptidase domain-containing protein [unclassified Leisingera]KIC17508.1 trypsin [Leisingera sp. ANG-DT]KIC23674.1 trypsin [Leisingera sp. ANG-S3]KIC27131.1 trypsin [Leisingera sp. ANG-M6]KIC32358.1 trypsin [Leisingera sp. ANG-S5]KIC52277.1 trypsin [Leisingera sp. ANG-S]